MTDIQKAIIRILSSRLFPVDGDLRESYYSEKPDSDFFLALFREARQQAVFPLAFSAVKSDAKECLSKPDYEKYSKLFLKHEASAIRNLHDHKDIHSLLELANKQYVIIKGQASAMFYPEPLLRVAGDVDFLIGESDSSSIDSLMLESGYIREESVDKHSFHWAYHKDNMVYEMHWSIPGLPKKGESISEYLSTILSDRKLITNQGCQFYAPSNFHHGIIILLHTLSHMTSTGIGLRHLCDWLVFVKAFSDEEFMGLFERPLKKLGLWKFAQVLTGIGIYFFGSEHYSWCAGVDDKYCEAILEDIIQGGNFGSKDYESRKIQAKLIRNTDTRKIKGKSVVRNVLANVNSKAKTAFPLAKKCPLLLPLGWMRVVWDYIKWSHSSKGRKVNLEDYSCAVNRQKLYSELRLFEPEDT
jgi:hypothetical protein